ncbi:hypothetical protein Btru_024333 [Bulinus truncatus]|nr:hypothetical protein Btru_024333 [Bulinus truncatus]
MYVITGEMVPLVIGMMVVVPLTYRSVRGILEQKLQFHTLLSTYLLRPLEIMLSVMMFPSAVVYIFVMTIYMSMSETVLLANYLVNYLTSSKWIYYAIYWTAFLSAYLLLIVVFINIIRAVFLFLVSL